jgi:hypothetical protein
VCWTVGFAIDIVVTRLNPRALRSSVPAHAGS